jgi:hypothetical protein
MEHSEQIDKTLVYGERHLLKSLSVGLAGKIVKGCLAILHKAA